MADIPRHLLWLHARHGVALSAALADRDGINLSPGAAIAVFAEADPTRGLRLTDWLVRTYVKQASFRFEDVRAGPQSTVGKTLALFVSKRGTLEPERRNINLYESPGALWKAVGGDKALKPSKREERARARSESAILVEDERGIVAVPLTEYAACWWGRGTRWCTAAREDNAFENYAGEGPLFVLILPDGRKAQFHVSSYGSDLKDAADDDMSAQDRQAFVELLDPLVLWAIDSNGSAMRFASDHLKQDRDTVLRAIRSNPDPEGLSEIVRHFHDDALIMREAVTRNPNVLANATNRIKADREIVIEAVKCDGSALEFALPELQNDREVVLQAVMTAPWTLRHASQRLRADRGIVMQAVTYYGLNLSQTPLFQDDREVVMAAVRSSGSALEHASLFLREDMDIVFEAVSLCGLAIAHARGGCMKHAKIVDAALASDGNALASLPSGLRKDRATVLKAVTTTGTALRHAGNIGLLSDHALVLTAVRENGEALEHAHPSLQGDRTIVMEAVKQTGYALSHASPELRDDPAIVMEAIRQNVWAFKHTGPSCRDNKDLVMMAISRSPRIVHHASARLQNDPDILSLLKGDSPLQASKAIAYTYEFGNLEWPRLEIPEPSEPSMP